jgi:Chaperone of endosialidase
MSRRTIVMITAATLVLIGNDISAQHIAPNALLTIDQNRATVIERIVGEWGDPLAQSNAGISAAQLRQILSGLRSDHLLAASLAGSVEGLRDVVSAALVRTDASVPSTRMHTKSLGDTTDDLVYTPVVPCRIVDTRSGGGGVFLPGNQRNWLAFSTGGFAAQGGSATNCGIPVRPAAIMANATLANTVGGPEFFTLWPFGQARPLASTVNWWASAQQPANAEIVPLCTGGACTSDFSAYASGQTHAIIDVLGYFNRPTNYGGAHTITGVDATDSGGFQNTASGTNSTVAGGNNNTASGNNSAVGGGSFSTASGDSSTIAGGNNSTASGLLSTVAGGSQNVASGVISFAAGRLAIADRDQCFVFANWTVATGIGSSCLGNTNIARFALDHGFSVDYASPRLDGGGTRWFYIGDLNAGNTIIAWNNARLTDAGVWVDGSSSKASKTDFVAVNTKQVLERVASLPITTWRYKQGEGEVRHMGPMAEDFWAAFRVGYGGQTIADLDARGVALAAIQGLHQMMQQKDAKLRQQSREMSTLKRKLQAIEARLGI